MRTKEEQAAYEQGVADQRATVSSWLRALVVFEENETIRATLDQLASVVEQGLHENVTVKLSPEALSRMAGIVAAEPAPNRELIETMRYLATRQQQVLLLQEDPPLPPPKEEVIDFIPLDYETIKRQVEEAEKWRTHILDALDKQGEELTADFLRVTGIKKVPPDSGSSS